MVAWFVVTFAVGLVMTFLGVRFWRRAGMVQKAAETWPSTTGAITKMQYGVDVATTENSTQSRYLQIFFTYTVDGKEYSKSKKIYDASRNYIEGPTKYPVGPIEIKYNPAKPKTAAFDISLIDEGQVTSILCFIAAFLAWVFFFVGAYTVLKH